MNKDLGSRYFHIEVAWTTKIPFCIDRTDVMSSTNPRPVSKISASANEWRKLCDSWTGTVKNGGSLFWRTCSRKQTVVVVNSYAFSKSLTVGIYWKQAIFAYFTCKKKYTFKHMRHIWIHPFIDLSLLKLKLSFYNSFAFLKKNFKIIFLLLNEFI